MAASALLLGAVLALHQPWPIALAGTPASSPAPGSRAPQRLFPNPAPASSEPADGAAAGPAGAGTGDRDRSADPILVPTTVRTGLHAGLLRIVIEGPAARAIRIEPVGDAVFITPGPLVDAAGLEKLAALGPPIRFAARQRGAVALGIALDARAQVRRPTPQRLVLDIAMARQRPPPSPSAGREASESIPAPAPPDQHPAHDAGGAAAAVAEPAAGASSGPTAGPGRSSPASTSPVRSAARPVLPLPEQLQSPESESVATSSMPSTRAPGTERAGIELRTPADSDRVPLLPTESPPDTAIQAPRPGPVSGDPSDLAAPAQLVGADGPLLDLAHPAAAGPCRPSGVGIQAPSRSLADGPDRPRLDLARCLIGRGLGAEAIAALEAGRPLDGPSTPTPEGPRATALRAAADLLLGRAAAADRALASLGGAEDAELALWRALAAAGSGDTARAWAALRRSGSVLDRYPTPLRRRLGPAVARLALAAGAPDTASAILAGLGALPLARSEKAQLALLEAEALMSRAPSAIAEGLLTGAMATGDWRIATEAAFVLTTARERTGRLTPEAALRELERQRLLWRGHPDELAMLRHLAGLELRAGQPMKAAATLTAILDRGGEGREAPSADPAIRSLFRELAKAASGDPALAVATLAIHRRLPTLLPVGEREEALRAIAAGLAAAGLDDTASSVRDEAGRLTTVAKW